MSVITYSLFQTWKRRYYEECVQSIYVFPYYESQWDPSTVLVTHILQNIFCYVQQNKETHGGLQQHDGEVNEDRIFIYASLTTSKILLYGIN